jgi:hypothetical protein
MMKISVSLVFASVLAAAVRRPSASTVDGFMFTKTAVSGPTTVTGDSSRRGDDGNYLHGGALSHRKDSVLFLSPDDLTNYMAKAHEEKVRALKEMEEKKNAEIKVSTPCF